LAATPLYSTPVANDVFGKKSQAIFGGACLEAAQARMQPQNGSPYSGLDF